ncbi:MAG: GDYXXLXY domain-containing protein [Acidobacteriota bacterium]
MKKGLLLAATQLALAMLVVGKFAYDRETLPRVWMQAKPYDPYLPLRGRYVELRLIDPKADKDARPVIVVYFIPEGVPDPSRLEPGEELWAEVSVPEKGLPRPIQLAVKKNGLITPLQLR